RASDENLSAFLYKQSNRSLIATAGPVWSLSRDRTSEYNFAIHAKASVQNAIGIITQEDKVITGTVPKSAPYDDFAVFLESQRLGGIPKLLIRTERGGHNSAHAKARIECAINIVTH